MVSLDMTDFQKIPKVVPVHEECNLHLVCNLVFDKLQDEFWETLSVFTNGWYINHLYLVRLKAAAYICGIFYDAYTGCLLVLWAGNGFLIWSMSFQLYLM
jgi:hypothetical protein